MPSLHTLSAPVAALLILGSTAPEAAAAKRNVAHPLSFPFASDLLDSATWQGVVARGDAKYGRLTVKAYLQRPGLELYDHERDPEETANLVDDPAHAKVREELLERLRAFQKRTGDPWLVKWSHE